jgi:thiamine transport system permease protein
LIFLLCAASFTIVLTLGGGPQATTLEAAIYQSLRADFDPARAAGLALLQVLLCIILGLTILRAGMPQTQATLRLKTQRYDGASTCAQVMDRAALIVLTLLVLLPLTTLVSKGLPSLGMSSLVLRATFTSLLFAGSSAALACAFAYVLAHAAARNKRLASLSQLTSFAGVVLPPAVIATGWFLIAINTTGLTIIAPLLIIALNSLLALPYAYGVMFPAMRSLAAQDRLAASLNISGWNRFWTIDRHALSAPTITAFAIATALALGDLAAILFFGDGRYVTLPALIYQQMGSYRMQGAMGTALILATLAGIVLMIAERAGKRA